MAKYPAPNGVQSTGTSSERARLDHVHPSDPSKVDKKDLARVALTGSYNDLTDKPEYGGDFPYITPEEYGAVGDGSTDDTDAVQHALAESITSGKTLFLERKYLVTDSLLPSPYYSNTSATIRIEGASPMNREQYAASGLGGGSIIFRDPNGEHTLHVFERMTLRGSIRYVNFAPVSKPNPASDNHYSVFYRCILRHFTFDECFVINVLAFLHNSSCRFITRIKFSTFLTCYYFNKEDWTLEENPNRNQHQFIDSTIEDCYINGGAEMTDNNCFEWGYFNGSNITGNFIDFYRTIYSPWYGPPENGATARGAFQGPICANNQYQVFKYFYNPTRCQNFQFQSDSDCFNHTDPNGSVSWQSKLQSYNSLTYTGHDGETHEMPPFVLGVFENDKVEINNAIFQSNIGNIVFVRSGLTLNSYAKAKLSCNINDSFFTADKYVALADSVYGGGANKLNLIDVPFIKNVEALPSIGDQWSSAAYPGMRVRNSDHVYRYRWVRENGSWVAKWVDEIPHVTQETVDESIAAALDTALYEPLDYLESDGASYIDTGILPSDDLRITARFQFASAASVSTATRQYVWGVFSSVGGEYDSRFQFKYSGSDDGGRLFAGWGASTNIFGSGVPIDADEHLASLNSGTFSFDSLGLFSLQDSSFENPKPIYLFACNEDGIADHYSNELRIIAVSFYRGDTPIA